MLLEALTRLDHPKHVALYHGIEKKIAELAPVIYTYARPQRFEFCRGYLKGYIPTPRPVSDGKLK